MDAQRRTVLAAGAAGAAALVTGCGDGGGDTETDRPAPPPATQEPPTDAGAPDSLPPAGKELTQTADIPVEGGRIFADEKVVVTQPVKGEFKAFSAICTHQGCTVTRVEDGVINCPCHGGQYRIADGSVARGPATRALPPEQITVSGDSILLA
ncbi:Rieske (2Fe-2S) protein [Streptomyces sp. MUM 178J]|uniref:Rieske (2Fe-2S) protein n=1 Tax=Streptomyces sp. MUM 178J TaxID=2791991 RepID=UPI001F0342E9|nr:Rieske (2Fe-2S) protein [Streptomyces sp. MUM 178J]WRQ78718.1 Rieske (2Fe-2S) protein [Streptomyces sp. MUM 178J]